MLAWLTLVVALVWALLLLNSAMFSAWMSGGPPNPFPEAWATRSKWQLAWSASVAVGGLAVFRVVRGGRMRHGLTVALVLAAALLGSYPSANEFLQIDRCLDAGGRWDYGRLRCEH
jgi:hypothetical protein